MRRCPLHATWTAMADPHRSDGGLTDSTPLGAVIIFGLIWSITTILFDGILVRSAFHQLRALTYSTTQGLIVETDLECLSLDEGGSYRPMIKYSYSVAGKEYSGNQRRYDEEGFGPRTARRIVDAYPVGRQVEVHHHPRDPADSVLRAGLEGIDLKNAMFLFPFNLIAMGLWVEVARRIHCRRHRARTLESGTSASVTTESRMSGDSKGVPVWLSSWLPVHTGLAVAGGLAIAGVFIVGFGYGSNPPLQAMLVAWAVILAGGLSAFLFHRFRRLSEPRSPL
jgi:hypothetical protein